MIMAHSLGRSRDRETLNTNQAVTKGTALSDPGDALIQREDALIDLDIADIAKHIRR
jgi:hypothetical protein